MKEDLAIDIPDSWEKIAPESQKGLLMVIGAPDVGKTFFARYLFGRLARISSRVAFLDGDPGQGVLGPPATMTMTFDLPAEIDLASSSGSSRFFVGSVTPLGHMLQLLTGAARLADLARIRGAKTVVYDTCGLIAPERGGYNLKRSKIDLLCPKAIFVLQREQELEPLVYPFRRSGRLVVIDVRISSTVRPRETLERQARRSEWYGRYFARASSLIVDWRKYAIIPAASFTVNQLVSLESRDGLSLGLGIVEEIDPVARQVILYTPLGSLKAVDALRLGDMTVDLETFADRRMPMF